MKLWNKRQPDAPEAGSAPAKNLAVLIDERISAATRLDAALIEVEQAIECLLAADRGFFDHVRMSGRHDHGTAGNLRRVLRTLIVGQMQNAAPQFIKIMGIPYQPARTRGTIANAVARTSSFDRSNLALEPLAERPEQ